MTGSLAMSPPATGPHGAAPARPAAGILPWAAFHLLCLWTRSDPESVGRMLGADGFDAGFGLGDGG